MPTKEKEIYKTGALIDATEKQGIMKVLRHDYQELMTLSPNTQRDLCRLFRDYLMSNVSLDYLAKLNMLLEYKLVATNKESRDAFSKWIENDVMGSISTICDTDVFDNPRSLSAFSEIVIALYSSLNMLDEEDIKEELDYLFDIPYRLSEMVIESPHIPRFRKHSVKYEKEDKTISKNVVIHETVNSLSVSYKMEIRR